MTRSAAQQTAVVFAASLLILAGTAGIFEARLSSGKVNAQSNAASKPKSASSDAGRTDEALAEGPENPFPQRIRVPDGMLDGGTGWLNTAGDITMRDLRGKIVLFDFWTYCCINCIHVLPDLKYLERKYPNELVVIGVHSAKFENEKDSEHIRRAIMRYNIEHPVVNDSDMILWRKFGVNSWPTCVLVDPDGYYVGSQSGEGHRELLDNVIGRLVAHHKAKGTLDLAPVHFSLEREKLAPTPLKFPGKVLADAEQGRLFITDTNHNRIVVASLDGQLLDVVGSGAIGASDGPYATATFDHPHGLALVGETLYVADTENHLLRTVDLAAKQVSTLAGTAAQVRAIFGPGARGGGRLRDTPLNSPWDLVVVDGTLFIAMAGPHQIWRHRLGSNLIEVFAGSGREDILDGPLAEAALAQPSGIDSDGKSLFFVDSEGSAVRKVPAVGRGAVSTMVGPSDLPSGQSLFAFGDVDDVGGRARLQHPIGITYHSGLLYVADSYNHKIKQVSPKTNRIVTLLGDGQSGDSLSPPRFHEPHGVTAANGKLFIADTNNHRICVADLSTKAVSVLEIQGLEPPRSTDPESTDPESTDAEEAPSVRRETPQRIPRQTIASGDDLVFEVAFRLPEGYKLNSLVPATFRATSDEPQELIAAEHLGRRTRVESDGTGTVIRVPLAQKTGEAALQLSLTYGYCRDGVGGLCKLDTARWLVPVNVVAEAPQKTVKLTAGSGK